jgi:pyruvate dehydrogenase E2 component (dihydrolipoamide acetyltransferase)
MIELRLPSFGADMDDALFVQWNVQPGQAVKQGDIACVVETQKGAIDVEVWQAGTVARLVAEPGDRLPVGHLLAVLAAEGEDWHAVAEAHLAAQAKAEAEAALQGAAAMPAGAGSPATSTPGAAPVVASGIAAPLPAGTAPPAPAAPAPAAAAAEPGAEAGVRASPAARKRAAELGVDLQALAASLGGRPLSLTDVERAGAASPAENMRAAIAAAMARSKREIPHYYLGCEIDVEAAVQWLERFNATRPVAERVLFAALALKAVGLALRDAPQLVGRFADGRFEPAKAIHLGVVTALRGGGLVVPTVHHADALPLPELMQHLADALARARRGQLRSSDLADSTVTVTNLGDLGTDTVYGVIYPPQVALIGLGQVAPRPVVRNGQVVAARTVHATLAADHRVSDGLVGARFLGALRERFQQPETLQ